MISHDDECNLKGNIMLKRTAKPLQCVFISSRSALQKAAWHFKQIRV